MGSDMYEYTYMSSIIYLSIVLYYNMFSSVGLSYVLLPFSRRKNSLEGKSFRICELLNNLFSRWRNCFSWKQIDDCLKIFSNKVSQIYKIYRTTRKAGQFKQPLYLEYNSLKRIFNKTGSILILKKWDKRCWVASKLPFLHFMKSHILLRQLRQLKTR